jgi:hypothetical protein
MAWTYTGDPKSSEKDEYRFLIRDTDANEPVLQDEEIQYILDTYSGKTDRLFNLFENAAVTFARAVKRSLGPQSEDPTERAKFFTDKADFYRRQVSQASGLSLPKSTPIIFTKGMHDNVRNS